MEPRLVVPMYAFVYIGTFLLAKGGNSMDFTMVIPNFKFKDFQEGGALAPIKVSVIGHEDEVLEEFQASANHSMYTVLKRK